MYLNIQLAPWWRLSMQNYCSGCCHTAACCYVTHGSCSILMQNDLPTPISSVTIALNFTSLPSVWPCCRPSLPFDSLQLNKGSFLPEACYVPAFLWKTPPAPYPLDHSLTHTHTHTRTHTHTTFGSGSSLCYVIVNPLASENICYASMTAFQNCPCEGLLLLNFRRGFLSKLFWNDCMR